MHKTTSLRTFWIVFISLVSLILVSLYLHITSGDFDITVMEILRTLLQIDSKPENELVLFEFRMPRMIVAALVGFGLGIAGAIIQGVSRNGLADPGILGINAGAGFAIVVFMFMFQGELFTDGWLGTMIMPIFGLVGGLLAAVVIFVMAWHRGTLDPQRLLLVGIAISSGFGALTLFISLKMNPNDFEAATVWLTGSIYNSNWLYITAMLPWLIILVPILMMKASVLDLLQMKDESASSLGIAINRERIVLLICSIGIVSACVSVSGSIGFVGLLAPHIARRLVGVTHNRLIPICGLIGMLIVVFSDYVGKTIVAPAELPVGIVISLVGVPYFVYLMIRTKGK
ncbi:FecCD family ABC transporter permease [Paenibacillus agilis]|uniref:Iron ABC transporter permease n=1 Tax=Paenibacillus agilis TaxID=3020863 RepID=A0A559IVX0_9BACL|nr:iron ABC transporter permease [Paenibacillus agilis]TVX91779.1 iron ABC transporter permease [Paenibacillus agilis]